MKLLRFIKNVWNAMWDSIFDGEDLKSFTKHMIGYLLGFAGFCLFCLGLGYIGKLFGWTKYVNDESVFGLGAVMFVGLFILLLVGLCFYQLFLFLKNIWNQS